MRVKHGMRYDLHGWTYVSIRGNPTQRGFAYGQLVRQDMVEVKRILEFMIYEDFGVPWSFFVEAARKYFIPQITESYPEFYEEMVGFAKGAYMSIDEVVAWNNYFTLTESWWANMPEEEASKVKPNAHISSTSKEGGAKERCSAFMAVGDWTADGKIVCAHNNFSNFIDGQLAKYVIDLQPSKGNRILMLGFPGWIWSGTDFFVTSAGIIGTETTIGGFVGYSPQVPISLRIRTAMQYGNTLEDYEQILITNNSGDYANSWLFGDIRSNEIMRIELGLRFHRTEKTRNGYFIGFNAAYDPRIRNLECVNSGFDDIRRHQGARKVRLDDLMIHFKGKLDVETAKQVIGDHYDVYLARENPCSRTCCSHYDLDGREFMSDPSRPKPFQPRGALDGNIVTSALAAKMSFVLRWGNSCGTPFDPDAFCNQNRIWKHLQPYLHPRPQQPWTTFSSNTTNKTNTLKSKKHNKNQKHRQRTRKTIT